MGNIPHLAKYCATKELTYIIYSYNSLDELLLGNKQLGDLNIVSSERQLDSCNIYQCCERWFACDITGKRYSEISLKDIT